MLFRSNDGNRVRDLCRGAGFNAALSHFSVEMIDKDGDRGPNPPQASVVELNTWALQSLIRYVDCEDVCRDLHDRYKEDFEGWTTVEFGKIHRQIQHRLRTFLSERGIYVPSNKVAQRLEELTTMDGIPR